jgi:phosphatidylglycerol:prolipoprotein diacylglycerol transferase
MRPVLFRWRGVTFYSYPTMLSAGVVLGLFAQQWAAARMELDVARTSAAALLLLAPALLGARLLYVGSHWDEFRREPRRIWRSSEGGAAMYGGLFLAVPLSIPLLALMQIPFGRFWDAASYTMLVGLIVTRAGCFLNGCCAGRPTGRWFGVYLADNRGVWRRRIPTQALEAAWASIVLAGAIVLERSVSGGSVFIYTVGAYASGRAILESTREEQARVYGFSLHRALSLGFVAATLVVLVLR